MTRRKYRTVAVIQAEVQEQERTLDGLKHELAQALLRASYTAGEDILFRTSAGEVQGKVGQTRTLADGCTEYWVYVQREDGFGSEGRRVHERDVLLPSQQVELIVLGEQHEDNT